MMRHAQQPAAREGHGIDRRCLVISLVEGFLFSLMTVLGRQLDDAGAITVDAMLFVLLAVAFAGFTAVCYLANRLLLKATERPAPPVQESGARRVCLVVSLVLLGVAAVVWYLALFPGVYWYDGPFWLQEWSDPSQQVTSKFSIPYTYSFYLCATFGANVLGSYEAGLAVFAALQALFVLYAEARVVVFVHKRFNLAAACLLPALFYALHPALNILLFSTAQDTPFMALFGLIAVHLLEMVDDPDAYWAGFRKPVLFALVILLFCLARNNGLYAVVLAVPFVLAYQRGYRLKLACVMVAPLLLFSLYQGLVLDVFGVDKSTTVQEMSSIPVQQVGRTYQNQQDRLTQQEKAQIESYIPAYALETYREFPCISDQLKVNLNVDLIQQDPLACLKLYAKLGLAYPKTYLEGMLLTNLGLWCPGKVYPDDRIYHPWIECVCAVPSQYWPDEGLVDMHSQSKLPGLYSLVEYLFGWEQQHFDETPVLGTLCRSATYVWLLLFAVGFALYARRYHQLVFLMPFVGIAVTIFLAPVVIFRYIVPLVFASPVLVASLFPRAAAGAARGKRRVPSDLAGAA